MEKASNEIQLEKLTQDLKALEQSTTEMDNDIEKELNWKLKQQKEFFS